MFKPTQEQLDIVEAFNDVEVLKINAISGSGKTSTLLLLANENPVPSLYICFNKQNAVQAEKVFPPHTECRTVHSLAYSEFGKMLAHKITTRDRQYINRGRTAKEIVNLYDIKGYKVAQDEDISPMTIAVIVKHTVGRFQNSADDNIESYHIPKKLLSNLNSKYDGANMSVIKKDIVKYAKKLWKDKINPHSPVKTDHDTYQKLYQLSKPKLKYEIIYLDEAQDSSPVVLDLIKHQDCRVVYVGDTYQSIYAFRQAVNAMELIEAPTQLLSKSFRYGEAIADYASYIIKNEIDVKGCDIDSVIINSETPLDDKYTMIFRTNSALLEKAVDLISNGVKVSCALDSKKFKSMILSSQALFTKNRKAIKDDEINIYGSWFEMMQEGKENPEISRLVNIVMGFKVDAYCDALDSLMETKTYDVLLTTAHKSKGLEWDTVVIADDYKFDSIFTAKGSQAYQQQEVNLFYVACTRAIRCLQLPTEVYNMYHGINDAKDVVSDIDGVDFDIDKDYLEEYFNV